MSHTGHPRLSSAEILSNAKATVRQITIHTPAFYLCLTPGFDGANL